MLRERSPRAWLAIAASVALHVALVAFMVSRPVPSPRVHAPAADVSLHWVDAQKPAEPPQPKALEAKPLKPSEKKKPTEREPVAQAPAGAPSETPSVATGPSSTSSFGDLPVNGQASLEPKLAPGLGVVMKMREAADAEGPHGTTIRNDPSELPDEVAVREYEGEKVSRKLNDELAQVLGKARSDSGNVPPFFKRIEKSMRERLLKEKVAKTDLSPGEKVKDIANVFLNPEIPAASANKVANSPLGRSVANHVTSGGAADNQAFQEANLQMMAHTQAVIDRISAVRLRTVLEFTQDARGTLADVRVVEKSGDPTFDDSVMHLSRKFVRDLPESDERGLGTHWWRSRWQFTYEPPEVRVRLMEAWPFSPPVQ